MLRPIQFTKRNESKKIVTLNKHNKNPRFTIEAAGYSDKGSRKISCHSRI